MPRRFTESEKSQIREALEAAGRELMGRLGVRRTSIDELASRAGISKGSFYRFFSGKEALALHLLAEWEEEFHKRIEARFRNSRPVGAQAVARLLAEVMLDDAPALMADSGMERLFDSSEILYLTRRAEPEEVRRMDDQDLRLYRTLQPRLRDAGLFPIAEEKVIVAALRVVSEGGTMSRPGPGGSLEGEHYRAGTVKLLEGLLTVTFREQEGEG
ncbi:MAG: TetR/AcrR family transcriptional regulator [Spirochaetia bacterium]